MATWHHHIVVYPKIAMDTIGVNQNSYVPLYIQLFRILRDAIQRGEYKSGEKLPSENDLIRQYAVSRITATAALDLLVDEHLAYRERGRGTFVAKSFISNFSFFSSFTEDMLERGLKPSSKMIRLEPSAPDAETIRKLKMPLEAEYKLLARVRLANNEPVVYQYAYLPSAMYPDIEKQDFEKDYLYHVMRKVYGYNPLWAEAIVEAAAASEDEAYYLGLDPGTPVLVIWHLTLDDKYTPLEFVRSVYRSDRFSFATGRSQLRSTSSA